MSRKEKFFCGTKSLPDDYDRYGSRFECMKRGYGRGMYDERVKREENKKEKRKEKRREEKEEKEEKEERRGRVRVEREEEKKDDNVKDTLNDIFHQIAILLHERQR